MRFALAIAFASFHCGAVLFLASPAPAQSFTAALVAEELLARGAEWKYFRGISAPAGGPLAWTGIGFDDSAWQAGPAGFGYGDGDDATLLADMQGRYSTVYVRGAFAVVDPDSFETLALVVDYDDGFVAYLNGVEVARANADPAGSIPTFNGIASASHEAGAAESFTVVGAGALLVAGANVLAVVGLNATLGSGDFSLHPELRNGGAVVEGCSGDVYVSDDALVLAGTAAVPSTSEVLVNGQSAAIDPASGDWSYRTTLSGGLPGDSRTLTAEARDAAGNVLARLELRAIRVSILHGELADGTRLCPDGGPYLVVGQVSLPAGRGLSIEAGCEVFVEPGIGFTIEGEVQALGSAAAPIHFTRVPCGDNWGFFRFEGARGTNRFTFCEWSWSTGDPGCLTVNDSDLELDSCTIRDIDGEGVHATGSTTRIRHCLSERTREAFSLDFGDTLVEFCTVRDAIGDSDLIDANGSVDPPARIAFNHIYNTSDDGIDADRGSVFAEGNIIHDCGDQAISLVGAGSSRVLRNICYDNFHGLSVKDSHECLAEFNTFVRNSITGVRAIEKTPGRGGGLITLRSSIVWMNTAQLLVESGGAIDVSYSDVEGMLMPGPGNLSLDPLFVDPSAADFRLLAGSPCIGAAETGEDIGALSFGFTPRPEVLGIEPSEGPSSGGTAVVIRGRFFQGEVTVHVGGVPLVEIVLASEEEIRGVTPPGTRGQVDLRVSTPHGQALREAAFNYLDSYARGDANGDGRRDLSDAVAILDFLFRGGLAPPCREVADANSDGAPDVSDAVFLLLFLFAGGPSPEPDTALCRGPNAAG